jgi:DNA mismatch repair ATPase MutS
MNAFLMFQNEDFTSRQKLPWNEGELKQDLELNTLCKAMASEDEFMYKIAMDALLSGLYNDLETILYRQDIIKDSLSNPSVIRDIYNITIQALEGRNKEWWFFKSSASSILYSSVATLQYLLGFLEQLRGIADEHARKFTSKGFTTFFAMLAHELDDEYLVSLKYHLKELEFNNGTLLSAELGTGNKGTGYKLRKPFDDRQNWFQKLFTIKTPVYAFSIHPRDDRGARALREIREEGINQVANLLAQSMDHILNFFKMLRIETAFYICCLNLHELLTGMGEPFVFPVPLESNQRFHSVKGLYDICLALTMKEKTVSNDLFTESKNLVLITGANKGGKSTFFGVLV